jgi:Tripartite tricarboxylate transporter TctB family
MNPRERLRGHFGELVCTGCLLATGLFITVYGLRYPLITSEGVVGPGVMPLITGGTLAAVTALLFARTIFDAFAAPEKDAVPAEVSLGDFNDESGSAGKPMTVAGILGMLVLSILLSPLFGLIPMLALTMFVCVFVFERQSFLIALLMGIGGGVAGWLIFVKLFDVAVPVGSVWSSLLGV